MNNIKSFKGYLTALLLLIIVSPAWCQVVVQRSKDKVIISGTPYYVHIVKKGETSYSISKAYGITVEELTKENPPAVYGINEEQVLRIPVREITENEPAKTVSAPVKKDEARYIYHKLQPGETIYSLSKLYGVSENEIISSNPRVDISRLPVNAEIAVPRREFMTERQEFAVQDSDYIFHKVVKGETLASIADKYRLSLKELRKENRNIRFPQVGDYIRIPVLKKVEAEIPEPQKTDSAVAVPDLTPVMWERPAGYTALREMKGSFDIAVLIPFYLRENAVRNDVDSSKFVKGKPIYKLVPRADDWIYSSSLGFLEMYQGILLAADTLRSLGLDINIHVFDIKADTIELTRLINNGTLTGMDLIVGPVYSHNLAIVADYARPLGIPVVSPVQLFSNTVLVNNPNLFMANASLEVAQNLLSRKVSEYFDNNFVFIHSDTANVDQDVKDFKGKIFLELSNRLPYEEIRFKEFTFYSRSAFDNDSINRLGHALSKEQDNTIIIASEAPSVISETLMEIHGLSKKYPLKVFGYPVMRTLEDLEPKYLFELDILIYSPYWIDYSRRDVRQFNADFRHKFMSEPQEMSFAWLGYDIVYYFLSGLAIHGAEFISHPEMHNPDLLQTQFDFRRNSINNGFENQKLYPVKFTRDYEVKLLPEENQEQ